MFSNDIDRIQPAISGYNQFIKSLFFYRNNFLEVNIFYRQLSYEEITQHEAYDIFALLCKYNFNCSVG